MKQYCPARRARLLALVLALGLLAACGGGAAPGGPTPDPRLAAIKVLTSQTHLVNDQATVVGQVQNGDASERDITLRAAFFDAGGAVIGQAEGVAEDIPAGRSGSFELHGQVEAARYARTEVNVVSIEERQ